MRPSFVSDDEVNRLLHNAEPAGNIFLEMPMSIEHSDLHNLLIGQFCQRMPHSLMGQSRMGTMVDTVQTIFTLGPPGKVGKKVIRAATIGMATFLPFGTSLREGDENELVD